MAETESETIEQPEPGPEREPESGSEQELESGPEQEASTGFVGKILALSRLAGPDDRLSGAVYRLSGRLRQISAVKVRIGLSAVAVLLAIVGIVVYSNRDQGPTPHEVLLQALELLDSPDGPDALAEAVTIAKKLRKQGYRDSDFAGGTEFVLGVVSFRNAQGLDEAQRERRFLSAANELRKSEALALDKSRRPEWAFTLGSSLYEIGKATEARPLLEEAVYGKEPYLPGRIEASTRLVDIYLDLKTEDVLLTAVSLLKTITDTKPPINFSQVDSYVAKTMNSRDQD
jgi:hypothetical protein